MSTKAVLLNGPPRCGKDTIGEMLYGLIGGYADGSPADPHALLRKFAWPIMEHMWEQHGIDMRTVNKDLVHPKLYGRTPREVAIAYSEKFCKPLFGQGFFGKHAAESLLGVVNGGMAIFTDSGFASEAEVLVDALGQGNVLQVRIARPGCDFRIDSRSYWSSPRIGYIDFVNAGHSLVDLRKSVEEELLPQILEWYRK